ncbi:Uncharacterised protein [Enterobacter cloacae]|uniref:Uncharacterized protein n=1 Tax=Enterobacter cloacae TaxID=550 RepID=A0A377M7U5_ENTCL|nr:Uncharacterised protein [Enterobacter cloacae]
MMTLLVINASCPTGWIVQWYVVSVPSYVDDEHVDAYAAISPNCQSGVWRKQLHYSEHMDSIRNGENYAMLSGIYSIIRMIMMG